MECDEHGNDVKVTDEDGFLSRSMTIKAKIITMKERIWTNRVAQRDVTNVKRSGEWLNMEVESLMIIRKVSSSFSMIEASLEIHSSTAVVFFQT